MPCGWSRTLDQLEDAVHRAGQDPESMPATWQPPTDLGPLPVEMVDRATRLVAQQEEAARGISLRLGATARHQSLVAALDSRSARQNRPPVYIDVCA